MIDFFFDFETRSRSDLKKVGPVKYVTDPSTEVTLITWGFARTGAIKYWRKGMALPEELLNIARNPQCFRFIAQNIAFDYLVWTQVFNKIIKDIKAPQLSQMEDLSALSAEYRMGHSLDSIATFLRMPYSKDKEGKRIMMKQSKPDRFGKFPELNEEEWKKFIHYGCIDTRLLRDCFYSLPALPMMERWAWEWTMKRNLRGIKIDTKLVGVLNKIVQAHRPFLEQQFMKITGCSPASPTKCLPWFKQFWPWIENMREETVREMFLDMRDIPPHARKALEIKDLVGGTAIKKIDAAINLEYAQRVFNLFAFSFAHTKRFAGRGIQIHNFPRVDDDALDKINFDLNVHDISQEVIKQYPELKDHMGFVKNLLRRIWIPDIGLTFYCGDFSKVEPSVLLWLLDMGEIPDKWYEEMAAEIYNKSPAEISKDSEERQIGKMANLSCQYGTGWEGFQKAVFKDTGIRLSDQMAQQVVSSYRRKNKKIADFWKQLEDSFYAAIQGQASSLCNGRIHFIPFKDKWDKSIKIRLPSGSYLYYHDVQVKWEEQEVETVEVVNGVVTKVKTTVLRRKITYLVDKNGAVKREYIYGGKLCENVVSAIARDLLVVAMWRLEQAGFDVLASIHDELWAQTIAGREEEFRRVMCESPHWCDMKIKSDLKVGVRYLK